MMAAVHSVGDASEADLLLLTDMGRHCRSRNAGRGKNKKSVGSKTGKVFYLPVHYRNESIILIHRPYVIVI